MRIDLGEVEKFIHYADYFNRPQISLEPIRARQDKGLVEELFLKSTEILERASLNEAKEPLFFVGSVDFMVRRENGEKKYYILETNGGSSRGFSALPAEHWQKACDGFAETLSFVQGKEPVVLIGHPKRDLLFYEKVFLAEILKAGLNGKEGSERKGGRGEERKSVLVKAYDEIIPKLRMEEDFIFWDDVRLDVVIGDGIVRRKKEICDALPAENIKTVIVNEVFPITDDKSLTYLAVSEAQELLSQFGIKPIFCLRSFNRKDLEKTCRKAMEKIPEVLIKPHGGSGGSGIEIIVEKNQIRKQIKESIRHYQEKFGSRRDPFPYTVCERVKATPISWKDFPHHFDVRIYVARREDKIFPVGALCRIALESFRGRFTKKSFVVNLSGYEGVDTERGLGINKESLDLLNLNKEDFVNMFCAAATLMAYISNNYSELISLADSEETS